MVQQLCEPVAKNRGKVFRQGYPACGRRCEEHESDSDQSRTVARLREARNTEHCSLQRLAHSGDTAVIIESTTLQ